MILFKRKRQRMPPPKEFDSMEDWANWIAAYMAINRPKHWFPKRLWLTSRSTVGAYFTIRKRNGKKHSALRAISLIPVLWAIHKD